MTVRQNVFPSAFFLPSAVLLFSLLFFGQIPAWAQDHSMHAGHEGMLMPGYEAADRSIQAKLLADKRESEFNHHLAGLFVLLGGLFLVVEKELRQRLRFVSFVWPATLLLAGIFVLVWSDTELRPFGPQAWSHALATNPEVLQHKIFAVILLVLGVIELQKVRGQLRAVWASWIFPVLAVAGSVLLLFHMHQAGAHGSHHTEVMARIQSEHLSYAAAGVAIALAKLLSDVRTSWQAVFQRLWPASLVVLGALLMTYVE
jgi:copper resistance protein D